MRAAKFPQQAELIERVKTALNLTDAQLAAEVDVRPETMQKYAAGYQKAGDRLLQVIDRLLADRRRPGAPVSAANSRHPAESPLNGERLPSAAVAEISSSLQEQLNRVLTEGTLDEMRLVRQLFDTLCRQIQSRQQPPPELLLLKGRHRILPALGYIPAGLPQEGIPQANQFIAVPEGQFPEADYALKVHGDSMIDAGIHHGDWVVMTTRREPRDGSVVAALCDGETCLKSYAVDDRRRPYLRSENRAYPPKIIPRDEMQIQGVMLGKLSANPPGEPQP
jgi:SOS-response transcriptional repressor LexA